MSRDAILALLKQRTEFTSRYDPDSWTFLGTGAFAVVARVQNRMLDQAVALKVFHRFDPAIRKRLQAEVTNTQRIRSHAVVQIHTAFFLDEDTAWLEMEYVDGPDLQRELDRREEEGAPFTTAEALDLALAATVPVAEAHAVGVIHRDLKPSNYLLPSSKTPLLKLGDFGISKNLQDAQLTGTGQFPGTPSWACPEAYDGLPLGTPADVYNLAALSFLLLANRPAYDVPRKATPSQWLAAHRHQSSRRIRDFNPDVHPALEDALRRALHKDPARRLPLSALTDAIRAAKQHLEAGRGRETVPSSPRGVTRVVAMVGVAAAVTAFATLALTRAIRPAAEPASPTQTPSLPYRQPPSPSPAGAVPARGSAGTTVASPPGAAAPPAIIPTPPFRLDIDSQSLTLTNATAGNVAGLSVTVVGADGAECAASVSGALGPGEEITLPVNAFSPRPSWPLKRVAVSADTPAGRRTFRLGLP